MSESRRLPWVTIALAITNIAVFGWELAQGADVMQPTAAWMGEHGGNFGALTFGGEPWRLLSSMFLHYGLLHIAMNMIGLIDGGRHVERMYGPAGFIVLYLLAGLAGSYATALRSNVMSAGASGAIFGVFGAFGAFLVLHRHRLDKEQVKKQSRGLLIFLAYNVYFGLTAKGIDLVAHAGGLVAGFLVGLALEVGTDHAQATLRRAAIVFVVGIGIIAGAVALAPSPEHSFDTFGATEMRVIDRWNAVVGEVQQGRIDLSMLGDILEQEILPSWRAARTRYERDARAGVFRDKVLAYITAREEGWELMLVGVRSNDTEKVEQGMARSREADAVLKALEQRAP